MARTNAIYVIGITLALHSAISASGENTRSSSIPEKYGDQWVMCRTLDVAVVGNHKEKKCGEQTWHTSKADVPSATEIFYWRDIIITAYDDNKTVRFTFDDLRAGWELSTGHGYLIRVYLLDANFTSLIAGGIPVFPQVGARFGYIPPKCDVAEPNRWRNKEYEYQLKGSDRLKYDDIRHIVFTLTPWAGGVGFTRC